MAFNYTGTAVTARRLIQKFCKAGTLIRSGGTYDPVAGSSIGAIETTGTVDYVELPSLKGAAGQGYLNQYQDDIVAGKVRFLLISCNGARF
jgi:hypothetical protein